MPRAIALHLDFSAIDLRRLARRRKDASQARRLLALAAIYDGGTRSEAALLGDVTLQIVRDWELRFNADGPDGLVDRKASGPNPALVHHETQREPHRQGGGRLDADYPANGGAFPRLFTRSVSGATLNP